MLLGGEQNVLSQKNLRSSLDRKNDKCVECDKRKQNQGRRLKFIVKDARVVIYVRCNEYKGNTGICKDLND